MTGRPEGRRHTDLKVGATRTRRAVPHGPEGRRHCCEITDLALGCGGIVERVEYEIIKRVLAALEREGVRYVVFGAAALNLHGLARFTEDLDLFVASDMANVEALKRALRSVFDDPHIDEISHADLAGDYPAIQYVPPDGTFHLDLVARLGEAFRFDDLEAMRMPVEDVTVSVASPATLYRMKRGTVRLKDRADAELLKQRFGLDDED
jgi:nucleotidyltransferase AbiEii toxin of type IV toxin-antitoxin system